jgi:hypothetical protein
LEAGIRSAAAASAAQGAGPSALPPSAAGSLLASLAKMDSRLPCHE